MEARCIFLIAVMYVLSISMVNSRRLVDKPNALTEWASYTPELANDERLVKIRGNSEYSSVVGRFKVDDETIFETVDIGISHYNKSVGLFGDFSPYEDDDDIQVLLIESGHYKWIPSSNGIVESNMIKCGDSGDDSAYICALPDGNGGYYAGIMVPNDGYCIANIGQRIKNKNYHLLVLQ